MSEYDKALIKCLEALSSMVSQVAVFVGEHMSEQEAGAFNRTYSKWNVAHQDLMREMEKDANE